jgi:nitroreductase
MNDRLSFLLSRRSAPAHLLSAPGPDAEELEALLTSASRVPDHGKLVPWRFIVIEGEARERAAEIAVTALVRAVPDVDPAKLAQTRRKYTEPPVTIGLVFRKREHPRIPDWEQWMTVGAVAQNIALGAHALGYSSNLLSFWDAEGQKEFGISENEVLAGFIHIGTPTTEFPERERPRLAELVTRL